MGLIDPPCPLVNARSAKDQHVLSQTCKRSLPGPPGCIDQKIQNPSATCTYDIKPIKVPGSEKRDLRDNYRLEVPLHDGGLHLRPSRRCTVYISNAVIFSEGANAQIQAFFSIAL